MAEVRLENVKKIYENGFVALSGATFSVAEGELVVLVGPSGCGKSTLLRMIAGLEPISEGTLSIDGRVVNDLPPKDRDIAMVFQSYALYPHMTVAENLGFGLSLRGTPKAETEARVQQAAEQLGLAELLDRRPGQLSGGQRQRVALGRALVRAPKVFLLDEPLSNLDAKLRLATRTQIARLQRGLGATMVYVTHDQIEAMTLGQRIVVLDGGVIQQIGAPMEIYRQPANLFVAGFFGSPAMNFLRGTLDGDGVLHGAAGAWDVRPLLQASPGLRDRIGSEVVLGLRPEDLRSSSSSSAAVAVDAFVDYVEPVGNEAFLNLRFQGEEWVARVAPEWLPAAGSPITLACEPAAVHCFDGATGVRIQLSR